METSIPQEIDTAIFKPREEILLQIPGATLHLMEDGETELLAQGEFTIVRLTYENIVLATVIKVGTDLQWPLTKDEPVVKVDELHYLFSLPSDEGDFLNYGVSFSGQSRGLTMLDRFLAENSCFSAPSTSLNSSSDSPGLYWRDFAPRIEDYNSVLAKAIAAGTGEILKGIFKCSNVYTKQVQKGGEVVRSCNEQGGSRASIEKSKSNKKNARKNKTEVQKGMKRVRKLSKMTEKMSKSLLDGVVFATGTVAKPLFQSKPGKAFLSMVPGEVLLATLDSVEKVLDAVEAAERQAFSATSGAVTRMVTQRYGENAGEVTEDALATAGHAVGTAWNIVKIRKAINPASSLRTSALKSAVKNKPRTK